VCWPLSPFGFFHLDILFGSTVVAPPDVRLYSFGGPFDLVAGSLVRINLLPPLPQSLKPSLRVGSEPPKFLLRHSQRMTLPPIGYGPAQVSHRGTCLSGCVFPSVSSFAFGPSLGTSK